MRGQFTFIGRNAMAALALASAATLGLGVIAAPAAQAKDKDKEAAKPSNSPEFAKAAGPFQKAFGEFAAKKGKIPDADFKAQAAAFVPQLAAMDASIKTPLDREIYGQWQQQVGGYVDDSALRVKGLQNMIDSGLLTPDLNLAVASQLGQIAYLANDYASAIKALSPVMVDPKVDDAVPQMLAESYASSGKPKDGLAALKTAIAARKAANAAAPEEWYARGNRIAYTAKLDAESTEWALLLASAYPTPMNWLSAAQLVRAGAANYTSAEDLDISRLLDVTGALKLDPKYVEREYVIYLQAIDPRRFPGEAVRVAEQGIATGALKASDTFVTDALTQARPRVAGDKASLPGLAKDAGAAPNGKVATAAGDAYLAYGDYAKADELFTLALTKGVADADKDRVLTRLAEAQIGEAKYADAKATLAKITGARAAIASLWSTYADQKSAAK